MLKFRDDEEWKPQNESVSFTAEKPDGGEVRFLVTRAALHTLTDQDSQAGMVAAVRAHRDRVREAAEVVFAHSVGTIPGVYTINVGDLDSTAAKSHAMPRPA